MLDPAEIVVDRGADADVNAKVLSDPAAARALVDFPASPETLALLKSRGFDVKP